MCTGASWNRIFVSRHEFTTVTSEDHQVSDTSPVGPCHMSQTVEVTVKGKLMSSVVWEQINVLNVEPFGTRNTNLPISLCEESEKSVKIKTKV